MMGIDSVSNRFPAADQLENFGGCTRLPAKAFGPGSDREKYIPNARYNTAKERRRFFLISSLLNAIIELSSGSGRTGCTDV